MSEIPWFKIDDGFTNAKPVLRIPRRHRASAIGLWTLAGAWSAKELTDGNIHDWLLEEFASTPAMAQQLVNCGLWEEVENGWRFRNWSKYQPTREQVEADREREAERKRAYRASKRSPSGTPAGRTVGHQAESRHPDPTRPDPTRPTKKTVALRADSDADFDAFWDAYGKKLDRAKAVAAFKKALKTTDAQTLIRAAAEHAAWHQRAGTESRFIKHAATWLNAAGWLDERPEPTRTSAPTNKADERMRANVSVIEELRQREQQASTRVIGTNQ